MIIEPPPRPGRVAAQAMEPLWKRMAWSGGLALTGSLSCAVIAYALKILLH